MAKFAETNKMGLYGVIPPQLLVGHIGEDPKKDLPETLRCTLS